jgi:hypothetical protein
VQPGPVVCSHRFHRPIDSSNNQGAKASNMLAAVFWPLGEERPGLESHWERGIHECSTYDKWACKNAKNKKTKTKKINGGCQAKFCGRHIHRRSTSCAVPASDIDRLCSSTASSSSMRLLLELSILTFVVDVPRANTLGIQRKNKH